MSIVWLLFVVLLIAAAAPEQQKKKRMYIIFCIIFHFQFLHNQLYRNFFSPFLFTVINTYCLQIEKINCTFYNNFMMIVLWYGWSSCLYSVHMMRAYESVLRYYCVEMSKLKCRIFEQYQLVHYLCSPARHLIVERAGDAHTQTHMIRLLENSSISVVF